MTVAAKSATAVNDADLQLLEGTVPVYSIPYATSAVDSVTPPGNGSAAPTVGDYLGGLSLGDTDWIANWTYGINPDNRGQALWFEAL